MEKAILLNQKNINYVNELAFQKVSQNKVKEAKKLYDLGVKLDPENITAILGKLISYSIKLHIISGAF
jgi:hypothetical protein